MDAETRTRFDSINRELQHLRETALTDLGKVQVDIANVKEVFRHDIDQLGEELTRSIVSLKTSIQEESATWRSDHNRADDKLWETHTGENGDHAQLAAQRNEDLNRSYWVIGIVVTVAVTVVGLLSWMWR